MGARRQLNEFIRPVGATQFALSVAAEGVPIVEVPQTVKNLSEAMKSCRAKIYAGRFHHDGNPVMTWMMSNVTRQTRQKREYFFPNKATPEAKLTVLSRCLCDESLAYCTVVVRLTSVHYR